MRTNPSACVQRKAAVSPSGPDTALPTTTLPSRLTAFAFDLPLGMNDPSSSRLPSASSDTGANPTQHAAKSGKLRLGQQRSIQRPFTLRSLFPLAGMTISARRMFSLQRGEDLDVRQLGTSRRLLLVTRAKVGTKDIRAGLRCSLGSAGLPKAASGQGTDQLRARIDQSVAVDERTSHG
jgi:hypothetical protein